MKYKNGEALMDAIRAHMYDDAPQAIADGINKSLACVYAIRSGRTKWPRDDTIWALLDFFGLELDIVKAGTARKSNVVQLRSLPMFKNAAAGRALVRGRAAR